MQSASDFGIVSGGVISSRSSSPMEDVTPSQSMSFFSLPAEIRLTIYEKYYENDSETAQYKQYVAKRRNTEPPIFDLIPERADTLAHVSSTIREESMLARWSATTLEVSQVPARYVKTLLTSLPKNCLTKISSLALKAPPLDMLLRNDLTLPEIALFEFYASFREIVKEMQLDKLIFVDRSGPWDRTRWFRLPIALPATTRRRLHFEFVVPFLAPIAIHQTPFEPMAKSVEIQIIQPHISKVLLHQVQPFRNAQVRLVHMQVCRVRLWIAALASMQIANLSARGQPVNQRIYQQHASMWTDTGIFRHL